MGRRSGEGYLSMDVDEGATYGVQSLLPLPFTDATINLNQSSSSSSLSKTRREESRYEGTSPKPLTFGSIGRREFCQSLGKDSLGIASTTSTPELQPPELHRIVQNCGTAHSSKPSHDQPALSSLPQQHRQGPHPLPALTHACALIHPYHPPPRLHSFPPDGSQLTQPPTDARHPLHPHNRARNLPPPLPTRLQHHNIKTGITIPLHGGTAEQHPVQSFDEVLCC